MENGGVICVGSFIGSGTFVATASVSARSVKLAPTAVEKARGATSSKADNSIATPLKGGKYLPFAALFFSPLLYFSMISLK